MQPPDRHREGHRPVGHPRHTFLVGENIVVRIALLSQTGLALVAQTGWPLVVDSHSRQLDIDLGLFRRIISTGVYPFDRYLELPFHAPGKIMVHPS
jgi:hypothetical protein